MSINKIVKSCKNCTINEVWVQITGMPSALDQTNPYPLFSDLKKNLEKDYQLQCGITDKNKPVLLGIQSGVHNVSICPPFWNGQIKWEEGKQTKIIRTGHQFFALHSLFDETNPYISYESSFEETLKNIMTYIKVDNSFKAVQIIIRYVNTLEFQKNERGQFDMGKYLNVNFSYNLKNAVLTSHFNCDFQSLSKPNRIIGISTAIRGNKTNSVTSIVQTTGVNPLENSILLNDGQIFDEIKSVKEELKTVFFEIMTEHTKNEIMEVRYV